MCIWRQPTNERSPLRVLRMVMPTHMLAAIAVAAARSALVSVAFFSAVAVASAGAVAGAVAVASAGAVASVSIGASAGASAGARAGVACSGPPERGPPATRGTHDTVGVFVRPDEAAVVEPHLVRAGGAGPGVGA